MRINRSTRLHRVVRILVYTYSDPDVMTEDQARWTHNHGSVNQDMRTASTLAELIPDYAHPEEVRLLRLIHSTAYMLVSVMDDDRTLESLDSETEAIVRELRANMNTLEGHYHSEDSRP